MKNQFKLFFLCVFTALSFHAFAQAVNSAGLHEEVFYLTDNVNGKSLKRSFKANKPSLYNSVTGQKPNHPDFIVRDSGATHDLTSVPIPELAVHGCNNNNYRVKMGAKYDKNSNKWDIWTDTAPIFDKFHVGKFLDHKKFCIIDWDGVTIWYVAIIYQGSKTLFNLTHTP